MNLFPFHIVILSCKLAQPMAKNFPAKILLFGEYTILLGSSAIAIPIKNFQSSWNFSDAPHPSQVHLQTLLQYLKTEDCDFLDLFRFDKELKRGLLFDTNIPIGYGAGSSGVVSAAVLYRFATNKSDKFDVVRGQLKFIEDHFHGNSSGLDPLVSYHQKPILIDTDKQIHFLEPLIRQDKCTFFLIDTQKSRSTAPLVEKFKALLQEENFLATIKQDLVPDVSKAIDHLQSENWDALFDTVHDISMFQYKYFKEMILPDFQDLWLRSLSSDLYKLKLCGAGGGGFILGVSQDYLAAKKQMRGYKLTKINPFGG